jgi:hypothetical protein
MTVTVSLEAVKSAIDFSTNDVLINLLNSGLVFLLVWIKSLKQYCANLT